MLSFETGPLDALELTKVVRVAGPGTPGTLWFVPPSGEIISVPPSLAFLYVRSGD